MRNMKNPIDIVKVPGRSGFEKSHFNLLTASVGSLVPIMVDPVIPNTKVHCRINLGAQLPPLASDTYMKCDVCVEAFYVPYRLLDGGFESYFCNRVDRVLKDATTSPYYSDVTICPPVVVLSTADQIPSYVLASGGLLDYLGFKMAYQASGQFSFCPYSVLAYHLIWQEFYRRTDVQNPAFMKHLPFVSASNSDNSYPFACAPYISFTDGGASYNYLIRLYDSIANHQHLLADGTDMFSLRRRNFDFDYFTNALPSPQNGPAQSVNVSGGSLSIASLRAANSMQQWTERESVAGARYSDNLKAMYGANLSLGVAQRPILLGSARYNVYNKSMTVNGFNMDSGVHNNSNPFATEAGGVMANAYANGSDVIIDGFTCNEPGLIMVIGSLVPRVTYGSGCRRYFSDFISGHSSIVDLPNPLLQNTGYQPIYQSELTSEIGTAGIFGYTDRYGHYMTYLDELHGLFRDGGSLDMFAAQRVFAPGSNPTINSAFLQIRGTYLDKVTAVSSALSNYGYWLECQFDYKVSMPLAEYSVPTLQDPAYEHGQTVKVHRGGFRF